MPLLDVTIGKKKSIHFQYRTPVGGVIGFSYSSVPKGITGELRRLAK